MKTWMRHLCPSYIGLGYGEWVGANRTHEFNGLEPAPIDDFDCGGMVHDYGLRVAQSDEHKEIEDICLWLHSCMVVPKSLYGKIYRRGLLIAFNPKK